MTEKKITPEAARAFVDWVKKDMETANNVGPGYMKRLIANYDVLLAEAEQRYLEGYPEWEQKIILEAQCCKEDKDD